MPEPASHSHQPDEPPRRRKADAQTAGDPYPFVYSRDIWDVRRFTPLGRAGPSRGTPGRLAMIGTWTTIVLFVLLIVWAIVSQAMASHPH